MGDEEYIKYCEKYSTEHKKEFDDAFISEEILNLGTPYEHGIVIEQEHSFDGEHFFEIPIEIVYDFGETEYNFAEIICSEDKRSSYTYFSLMKSPDGFLLEKEDKHSNNKSIIGEFATILEAIETHFEDAIENLDY